MPETHEPVQVCHLLRCVGLVQGVGFRPFVHRLANRHGLQGWVRNLAGQVEILVQGHSAALRAFQHALIAEAPPAATPRIAFSESRALRPLQGFVILPSDASAPAHVHVPLDAYACPDCLREFATPGNRRYRYPFSNCTHCGPRYTLIQALPYDRATTTMAGFPLCRHCAEEYTDIEDRRYHAEPIACPACGPQLCWQADAQTNMYGEQALQAALQALRHGAIVALKGIGGFQLLCDATDEAAVARLRRRKHRPDKPLAVMFPDDPTLSMLQLSTAPSAIELRQLCGRERPIVLVQRRADAPLAPSIAPGCGEIGAMLPSSLLHALILQELPIPLVATSGNVAGEPMLTEDAQALQRLGSIADGFLLHDRPIARPADDPVRRVIAGRPRLLRPGRGCAPLELELPLSLPRPVLALGGHSKVTVALAWQQRAVLSPHLGHMQSPRARSLLRSVAEDLQHLYGVSAAAIVCDAHPDYATSRIAADAGLPLMRVYHHRAHASALVAEHGDTDADQPWLVFTWDGSGLGEDGTLWGGEALLGRPGNWQRMASFRQFALPGGERAAREPWRSALALACECGHGWRPQLPAEHLRLMEGACDADQGPRTSSVGRLFDAAAALLGLAQRCSYEGQAAIALEAACTHTAAPALTLPLQRSADGLWRSDWAPLLTMLTDTRLSIGERASVFHETLASTLIEQARAIASEYGTLRLGVSGGVFQNRVLTEAVLRRAASVGISVVLPERIPANDAGLSLGQLIEYACCPPDVPVPLAASRAQSHCLEPSDEYPR